MNKKLISIFISGLFFASNAIAGSIAGTGGASEIVQLMNNAELVGQLGESTQQTLLQIEHQIQLVTQTNAQLKQLQTLNPAALKSVLGPMSGKVTPYVEAANLVSNLGNSSASYNTYANAALSSMQTAGVSPKEYYTKAADAAAHGSKIWDNALTNDKKVMDSVQTDHQAVADFANNHANITSSVEGLGALAAQNVQTQSIMIDQKAALAQILAESHDEKAIQLDKERKSHDFMLQNAAAKEAEGNTITNPLTPTIIDKNHTGLGY